MKHNEKFGAKHMQLLNMSSTPTEPVYQAAAVAMAKVVETGKGMKDLSELGMLPGMEYQVTSNIKEDLSPAMKERIRGRVQASHPPPVEKVEDFCGVAGTWTEHIPDRIGPMNLRIACQNHDNRYATLGISKEKADNEFLRDLLVAARTSSFLSRRPTDQLIELLLRFEVAYVYYYAVDIFGHGPYDAAQINAAMNEQLGREQ